MADIQIPQRQPQYVNPVAPPTDVINGYLQRQYDANQNTIKALPQALEQIVAYRQKQQQLKAGAFEAGGPYLMNMLYGNNQQASNTPSGQTTGQNPPPPQTPTTATATPQTAVTGQNPPGQPQSYGSPIEASIKGLGHPDFTGMLNEAQQYQNMGKYGREQTQNLQAQGNLAMMPLAAADKEASLRASNAKFATPSQGAAVASGDPDAIAGAYGGQAPLEAYQYAGNKQMEKAKAVTGEVGKLTAQKTEVKTLQGMFDNLDKNLHGYYKDPKAFIGSGNLYQATKGRMGSPTGAEAINQGKPLVAALNQILTKRFNFAESSLLQDALAPSPNDTPKYAASKMKMIHQMVQAMDTGNKENVSAVMEAINGKLQGLQ